MRKPRTAEVTAYLQSDIKSVWNVVTNNNDYKWRSDIEKIEIINDGKEFIEYTSSGIATKFFITKKEEYSQYKFSMGNKMFTGFWTGHFSKTKNGGTKMVFVENIFIKNPIIKILSYFFMDLKKMQNIYILDLKKKLGEQ
ncbi:hypothetical protein RSJ21_08665 [Clostridium botulinum]|uniref:hypothetical protein n=1 Tax=Clostridium botulinum TaxID=1491 RepID=UPI00035BA084|nr:hypothetical protein [Clostridium botulinum]APH24034.1 hypothetical protein NPD1_3022 [Clostridium botulinum]APQ70660.1 hypothetical protein RSJ8_1148 [Clostridium botulinum]APQ74677.1 hypothetical protein RSJ9_2016 [Clostridium botulinum]AUM87677.1 hypothetical protein RSJ15_08175 [Clostridium botulinum]AUN11321.1 hypothetical protein RSJ6_12775 [Clostridium botulinum]